MTASQTQPTLNVDDAIRHLRNDPAQAQLVQDAYLGRDVRESAERFLQSAEFQEVCRILGPRLQDADVLDVGAGTGIASYSMLASGARRVIALEPDASDEVGRGAIRRLDPEGRIDIIDGFGEDIPLDDATVDVVYARQLMHHAQNLPGLVSECARVLRTGGVFIGCREHVVDDVTELEAFLAGHPVHRLAGGENAYSLSEYVQALQAADLDVREILGPWDSIINAYPAVRSPGELKNHARAALERRFGAIGRLASLFPGVQRLVRSRIQRVDPGRLYTFVALKRAQE